MKIFLRELNKINECEVNIFLTYVKLTLSSIAEIQNLLHRYTDELLFNIIISRLVLVLMVCILMCCAKQKPTASNFVYVINILCIFTFNKISVCLIGASIFEKIV